MFGWPYSPLLAAATLLAQAAGTGTGSAAGTSTVTGVSAATAASTGTGTATGLAAHTAAASGTSTVTGLSASTGSAAGTSTVSGISAATAAATGTGTATGRAAVTANAAGTSTVSGFRGDIATAEAAGTSTVTGLSAYTAAASGTGTALAIAAFVAQAAGTGVATGIAAHTATAAGTGTALAIAAHIATAAGTGTATALMAATASAVGTSTVDGVKGDADSSIAEASGTATVLGVAAHTAQATGTGTATGMSAATAASSGTGTVIGISAHTATAAGTGTAAALSAHTASASGTSTVLGVTAYRGVSSGTATVSGLMAAIANAAGTATVIGQVPSDVFVSNTVILQAGNVDASVSVSGVQATGALGTVSINHIRTLVGVGAVGSVGTIVKVHLPRIVGVQGAGQVGEDVPTLRKGVTGVLGTTAVGTVTTTSTAPAQTVDIDFMSGILDSRISVTRAANKWAWDSAGLIVNYGHNSLPLEHDPFNNNVAIGRMIEPAIENLIWPARDFDHANWTKAANVTRTGGHLGPDGNTDAHRIVMPASTSTFMNIAFSCTAGTRYYGSLFMKRVTTTSRPRIMITQNADNSGTLATVDVDSLTTKWLRFSVNWLATYTGTAYFSLDNAQVDGANNSVPVDEYVWGGMVHAGNYLATYVDTTTAPVTRSRDQVSFVSVSALSLVEGTMFSNFKLLENATAESPIAYFKDGSDNNHLSYYVASGNTIFGRIKSGNVVQMNVSNSAVIPINTNAKAGILYKAGDSLSGTGTSTVTPTLSAVDVVNTMPTSITQGFVGSDGTTTMPLLIKRFTYIPTRRTNTQFLTDLVVPAETPSTDLLTWDPDLVAFVEPTASQYNISPTGGTVNLTAGEKATIMLNQNTGDVTGPVVINGIEGSNNVIRIMGGYINRTDIPLAASVDNDCLIIANVDKVFIEGLKINGNYRPRRGIVISHADGAGDFYIQNTRIEKIGHSSVACGDAFDGDGFPIHIASQINSLQMDKVTTESQFRGFLLGSSAGNQIVPGAAITDSMTLKRCNFRIFSDANRITALCQTQDRALVLYGNCSHPKYNLTLEDVWVTDDDALRTIDLLVLPSSESAGTAACAMTLTGSGQTGTLSPHSSFDTFWTGQIKGGVPVTGDFVPATFTALSYVSPGYEGTPAEKLTWDPDIVCVLRPGFQTFNVPTNTPTTIHTINLPTNTDALVTLNNGTGVVNGCVRVNGDGTQRLRVIGGSIIYPVQSGSGTPTTDSRCLDLNNINIAFIEGVKLDKANAAGSGLCFRGVTAGTLYAQNCLIVGSNDNTTVTGIGLEIASVCDGVFLDKVTVRSWNRAFSMPDSPLVQAVTQLDVRRSNFVIVNSVGNPQTLPAPVDHVAMRLFPTCSAPQFQANFDDVWVNDEDSAIRQNILGLIVPGTDAGTTCQGTIIGDQFSGVYDPASIFANWVGTINGGAPQNGDFVTHDGLSYTTPGYLDAEPPPPPPPPPPGGTIFLNRWGPAMHMTSVGEVNIRRGRHPALRFRAMHTGQLNGIHWYMVHPDTTLTRNDGTPCPPGYSAGDGGRIRISCQTLDSTLRPTGNIIGQCPIIEGHHGPNATNPVGAFTTTVFNVKPNLVAGTRYAIVWDNLHSDPDNNFVSVDFPNLGITSQNIDLGQVVLTHVNFDNSCVLQKQATQPNSSWFERFERMPGCVDLIYTDGFVQGGGEFMGAYMENGADEPITTTTWIRQLFTPERTFTADGFHFLCGKSSTTMSPLTIRLYQGTGPGGTLLRTLSMTAASFGSTTGTGRSSQRYGSTAISPAVTFNANTQYSFIVFSSGTTGNWSTSSAQDGAQSGNSTSQCTRWGGVPIGYINGAGNNVMGQGGRSTNSGSTWTNTGVDDFMFFFDTI